MSRLHILFIDSDLYAHKRLLNALQHDFSIQCVRSITEAEQQLNIHIPDIVITEVRLNGTESGLDLCRYLRSIPSLKHLPIMILTSLATIQDKIAGFEAGADDYVVKPFDASHLIARTHLLTRIKHLEQQER